MGTSRSIAASLRSQHARKLPAAFAPANLERPWSIYFSGAPEGEYGYYGEGFLEAARTLARSYGRRRGPRSVDPLPVLFLYRHSIELLAKAVILSGNELMQLRGSGRAESEVFASFRRTRHRLVPLLPLIKEVFDFLGWEWLWPRSSVRTYEDARQVVSELERLDPDSFNFRYPTNTRGQRAAPPDRVIGVRTVFRVLDDLAEALDTAVFGLDAELGHIP